MIRGTTETADRITVNRPVISTYFYALETDGEAWIVQPEYRFLEPTLLAWLARHGAGAI